MDDGSGSEGSVTISVLKVDFPNVIQYIELGQANIRVNAILPGAVEGPRIQHVIERMTNVSGKSSPK